MIKWFSIPGHSGQVYSIVSTTQYDTNYSTSDLFDSAEDAVAYVKNVLGVPSVGHMYIPYYYADMTPADADAYLILQEFSLALDRPLVNEYVIGNVTPSNTHYKGVGTQHGMLGAEAGQIPNYDTTVLCPFAFSNYGKNLYVNATMVDIRFHFSIVPDSALVNGILDTSNVSACNTVRIVFTFDARRTHKYGAAVSSVNCHSTKTADYLSGQEAHSEQETSDPYTGAGYPASTAPGGYSGGSFDFAEDGITGVHTPGLDLLNTGLITAWRPSKAILAQLAGWLWVTTPGQIVQQLFGNPINAIIGLNIVPVSPPVDGGTNTIKFGAVDSGVACPKITSQHVTVDCGTLTIDPKYGSYMDFAPQTSAELFLPYVGGLPLDVNDVIGKTIGVKYQVDVLSGACVAYVFIDGVLHYQKAGSCAATAPITGSQMPNVVSGVLSIAGSVAGFVASAGASGASTAAKVASGIAAGTSVAESAANMLKQSVSYSGTISGWAGLLGAQKPYLILSLPHAAIPGGQNTLMGYPAWVSGRVGDFTGYTECTVDRVTATRATDKEVEEIKSLLEGGVIL